MRENEIKYISLTQSEREGLIEKVGSFFSVRKDVVFAYLFGSCITGETFRDMDIAVFLKEAPTMPLKLEISLSNEIWQFLGKPKFEVDVKVLNSAPVYFQYEVIKTGRIIYSKDEAERIEYEATEASEYLDYKPTLEFFDQELLARIG